MHMRSLASMLMYAGCASAFAASRPRLLPAKSALASPRHSMSTMSLSSAAAVVPLGRGLALASVLQVNRVPYVDRAVLVATAVAASIDLGPAAARQLSSASQARRQTPGSAANRWQSTVRVKVAGQIAGLVSSAFGAALVGAALIIAADALFWLLGGGAARFADDGLPAPIPVKLCRVLLCINLVLLLAAVVAGAAPQGFRRSAGAAAYITGVLAQVFGNEKTRRKNQA